jgi:hypothetical protein
VFYPLSPSQDEWGLKYDLQVTAADGDKLNVLFTLADAGRLKPIYSATVVAFSRPDITGGQSYLVKERIKLKPTNQGTRTGQVQIPKEFFNIARIRILTLRVDGRPQTAGAAYYDIPLKRLLNKPPLKTSPAAPPSLAAPPSSKVTK